MAIEILNDSIISTLIHIWNYTCGCVIFYTDLLVVSSLMDFLLLRDCSYCLLRSWSSWDSLESLPATFLLSSITSWKHGSQYATELPAFQPLTVSSFWNTEVFLAPQTSIFCICRARGARILFFPCHFLKSSLLYMATTGKQAGLWENVCQMYALGSAHLKIDVWIQVDLLLFYSTSSVE